MEPLWFHQHGPARSAEPIGYQLYSPMMPKEKMVSCLPSLSMLFCSGVLGVCRLRRREGRGTMVRNLGHYAQIFDKHDGVEGGGEAHMEF